MKNIMNNPIKFLSHISEEAKSLVKGILQYQPEDRMSIDEILAHPWMKKYEKLAKLNLDSPPETTKNKENSLIKKHRKHSIIEKTLKKVKNKDRPKF